jgi:hypothetical protein
MKDLLKALLKTLLAHYGYQHWLHNVFNGILMMVDNMRNNAEIAFKSGCFSSHGKQLLSLIDKNESHDLLMS